MLSRNGVYYFRIAIPKDLRHVFDGQSEIKKSLKTKNRKVAKASEAQCRYKADSLFLGVRLGMITVEQAKKIRSMIIGEAISDLHNSVPIFPDEQEFADIAKFTRKRIVRQEFSRKNVFDALDNKCVDDYSFLREQAWFFVVNSPGYGSATYHPYIIRRVAYLVGEMNLDVLVPSSVQNSENLTADINSNLFKDFFDLCTLVYRALSNVVDFEMSKHNDPPEWDHRLHQNLIKQYKDGLPNPKLSELWDAYYQDKTSRNEWRDGTAERYTGLYMIALDIVGDIEIEQIDGRTVQTLISSLKHYPKNKNKKSQFKDKPFSKAMSKMPGFEPLDVTSINYVIGVMSGLFKFALEDRRRWRLDNNPFFRKQVKDVRQREAHEYRREFTHHELNMIIGELGKVKRFVNPEKLWVPLICLYSGMRINEACQLRIKDIECIDGIPVFHIYHNLEVGLATKNAKSRRVPIHKTLQQLGFLEYVSLQKDRKEERLFAKLTFYKGKWSKKVNTWFNRTVLRSHLELDENVSFHSTKHTFINWFKQNVSLDSSQMSMLKYVAAHFDDSNLSSKYDDGGITMNLYGKDYDVKALYDFINKVDYKVDLSILEQIKNRSIS